MTEIACEERTVGPFLLLTKLGEGSFGAVWTASDSRDPQGPLVALKVFLADQDEASQANIKHMIRESRIGGSLQHPNIAGVRDYGCDGDRHYLVTPYITGQMLHQWAQQNQPGYAARARIMALLGDAVQYLHDQGVIHHDLKPSNVIVDQENQPHLIDFGLATTRDADCQAVDQIRRLNAKLQTQGQGRLLIGTPDYMAPEKIRGECDPLSHASDIYSLGVVFYELLTGQRPFTGSGDRLLQAITHRRPRRPRLRRWSVPKSLESVCLQALAMQPDRRYASAAAMAADCRAYLAGQPVAARPATWLGRLTRAFKGPARRPSAPLPQLTAANAPAEVGDTAVGNS